MSFSNRRDCLEDILRSIDLIGKFVTGMDCATYRADHKTRLAVERLLQNLTEAGHRLGPNAQQLCPTVDWRSIRGLGNVLRHEYDEIDDGMIWQTIQLRLPSLRVAVQSALATLHKSSEDDLA